MVVRFRPLPVLSFCAVLAMVLLVALGLWQARRAMWKAALIEAYEQIRSAPPASSLADALCGTDEWWPLIPADLIEPAVGGQSQLRVFGRGPLGRPGWRHLSAVEAPDCGGGSIHVLVETGFETAEDGIITEVNTLLPTPWPRKPLIAASNDAETNQWYWLDAETVPQALGIAPELFRSDLYLTSARRRPEWLIRTPTARHIVYSLTWFMLAAAVLAFYVIYHIKQGRLGLTP